MPAGPIMARLKRGREKLVARGHPWVFSGALAGWEGRPEVGATVDVIAADGAWLGRGLAHPEAPVAVRIYSREKGRALDAPFWRQRIEHALAPRERLFMDRAALARTDAFRLVFAEADGLSGLIADRYADTLSVEVNTAVLQPHLDPLLSELVSRAGTRRIAVRYNEEEWRREGAAAVPVPMESALDAAKVRIRENRLLFDVDVTGGQKTGFFLDQRDNRQRVAAYACGRRVLGAYCYTGAFETACAVAGARSVLGVDSSAKALEAAQAHLQLNAPGIPAEWRQADVATALRRFRDEGRVFDLIVLDPPRFVAHAAQKNKGLRAYKDINLLAIKLLSPGGILASFSCSGLVSPVEFQTMLAWAACDAGRPVRMIETLGQPPDHPIPTFFPESAYLKGIIAWVD